MKNIVGICIGVLVTGYACAGVQLSNEELRIYFSGYTIHAVHFKNGAGKTYYGNDGSVRSIAEDGHERTGKWWIKEKKQYRCVRWDGQDKDFCRQVFKNDDGTYSLVRPKDGKRLVEFVGREEGEHL